MSRYVPAPYIRWREYPDLNKRIKYLVIPLLLFALLAIQSCSFNILYYYPDTNAVAPDPDGEDVFLEWSNNDTFHGVFFKHEEPKASIYFLHGNAGNLTGWNKLAKKIRNQGYNVFIIDYPGFGNSEKKPRHGRTIKAAQVGFEYFVERPEVVDTKKILFGMSLGGNLATKIGVDNQDRLDGMVLEGPFASHRRIGLSRVPRGLKWLAFTMLRNKIVGHRIIKKWHKPLLVVHSTEDKVCKYKYGKMIYENAGSEEKELWTIDGKHIRGLSLYTDRYFEKLDSLVLKTNSLQTEKR